MDGKYDTLAIAGKALYCSIDRDLQEYGEQLMKGKKGAIVAIGSFDGVHRGHQSVLARLKEHAKARGVPAVMLTFEPHPRDVFAPTPFMFRLTPPDIKARLVAAFGLDGIVLMPFSRDLSMVEAEDFVSRFLVKALRVSGVAVGGDFHFGHNRRGTPDFLRAAGKIHGFEVDILDPRRQPLE